MTAHVVQSPIWMAHEDVWVALLQRLAGAVDGRPGLEGRIARRLQQRRYTMTRMNLAALVGTACFSLVVGTAMLATSLRVADPPAPPPVLTAALAAGQGSVEGRRGTADGGDADPGGPGADAERKLERALAEVDLRLARSRLERVKPLAAAGQISAEEVERAEADLKRAELRVRIATAGADERAKLERQLAEVDLAEARARLERLQALHKGGAVGVEALEQAEANLRRAEIRLQMAGATAAERARLQRQLAEVSVAEARQKLERLQRLHRQAIVSREEVEQAEAELLKAELRLKAAQERAARDPAGAATKEEKAK